MIRTVTLGALCLAGLGAIAVAKVTPVKVAQTPLAGTTQTTAGNKSDRLPLSAGPRNDMPTGLNKIDVLYVAPADAPPEPQNNSKPRATVPLSSDKIISRHWHDPHDIKVKRLMSVSADTRQSKK
jgi:hypothetical protein